LTITNVMCFILVGSVLLYATLTIMSIMVFITTIGGRKKRASQGKTSGCEALVEFVIVTKASVHVMNSLKVVIKKVKELFPDKALWVVTDEGSDGLSLLTKLAKLYGFKLIVVPKNYNKGKYKARAINYFIENYVRDNRWYVFLDDDSYPLDRKFLCELREEIPVYNGILAPREGGNRLLWLADSVRYYSDITKHRFALEKLRKAIYGLHGELLIVKGWVLKDIGFETDSVSEDSWFAAKLIERKIPVGQVSTRVSILSPGSIYDFVRQRGRWLAGRLRDFLRGEYPPLMALAYLQELLLALALPLSPLIFFIKILYPVKIKGIIILIGIVAGTAGFLLGSISYMLYHIIERNDLRTSLIIILLLPVFAFLESLGVIYGLVNYKKLSRSFIVINKSLNKEIPKRESLKLQKMIKFSELIALNRTLKKQELLLEERLYENIYYIKIKVV
jgi:egghead protein (zeste-white 4 protein)